MCHVPSVINDLWSKIYVSLRTSQHTIAAQNEDVTKAIASFYWDDWETVFLVFLRSTSHCDTCQLFLSQMREIFTLSWPIFPETFRRVPKISDELPKTSERCRKLNVRRCSRRLLSDFVGTQKRTQSHNVLRIICSDLWVRREQLSLIRDIDVFIPQA